MSDSSGGSSSRHLGLEGVKQYVREGVPGTVQVDGTPTAYLLIDPKSKRLAVHLPADGNVPDCSRYENVEATRVRRDGADWNELSVHAGDRIEDVYPLLCQVLDRVQLDSQTFSGAVLDVLDVYRDVLTHRTGMAEANQVGLFGELLVLRHLVVTAGSLSAMGRWLGPSSEEHDFAFDGFDLEVKTTTAERRRHWISSLTQLMPSHGRSLIVVSLQITAAGHQGQTLPMLVNEVAALVGEQAPNFWDALERVGYVPDEADLYPKRWTLRTMPLTFAVDATFPALHEPGLGKIVADPARILDVTYLIDLTGLPSIQVDALLGFEASEGVQPE